MSFTLPWWTGMVGYTTAFLRTWSRTDLFVCDFCSIFTISDLSHFSSTVDGSVVTLDRRSGEMLWDSSYSSPVVGLYTLNGDGLKKVAFTSISPGTMGHLLDADDGDDFSDWRNRLLEFSKDDSLL